METNTENVNEAEKITDAVEYIKDSNIFSDKKYEWIKPLVEKVLDNSYSQIDLANLFPVDKQDESVVTNTISVPSSYAIKKREVASIAEISKVENVGLVDVGEPIALTKGLNVFYGKNGSGKSSIYGGLCNVFGKDHTIYSNLNNDATESVVKIKYLNESGEVKDFEWKTGEKNGDSPVMIFDNTIAQTLVETDQNNTFEIAHLKLEYFSHLNQLYSDVENRLRTLFQTKSDLVDSFVQNNSENLGFLSQKSNEEVQGFLEMKVTKEHRDELDGHKKDLQILIKDSTDSVVKNLTTVQTALLNLLIVFGDKEDFTEVWSAKHDEAKIDSLNKNITKFNELKKAFEEGGVAKIVSQINKDWVSQDKWLLFIQQSIEFTDSLSEAEVAEYGSEKCLYCQQPLATHESKKLVEAYREITSEHDSKLKEKEEHLTGIKNTIVNRYIFQLESIAQNLTPLVLAETQHFKELPEKDFDEEDIVLIYNKIHTGLEELAKINLSETELTSLSNFFDYYVSLYDAFGEKITELNKAVADKDNSIKELNQKIGPLQGLINVDTYRTQITSYLENKKQKEIIEQRIADMSTFKQYRSTLESKFSNLAGLKEFRECLESEQKGLRFTPPAFWKLKAITPGGVSKRSYSLNDRKLSDIFSEGERKLHALADFFAHCSVSKHKGVYIFDDPVNSLDEDNIHLVAKRIHRLADDGNQVIVFTHNLYFLNSLDISNGKMKVNNLNKVRESQSIFISTEVFDEDKMLKNTFSEIESRISLLEQEQSPNTIDIKTVYSLISEYLESYVERKLFNGVISRYRRNISVGRLEKVSEIESDKIKLILEIYIRTGGDALRHSNPVEIPEPTLIQLKEDFEAITENLNYKTE